MIKETSYILRVRLCVCKIKDDLQGVANTCESIYDSSSSSFDENYKTNEFEKKTCD